MSDYSTKQEQFATDLLNILGFTDIHLINKFLTGYANKYGVYQQYPSGTYLNVSESISQLLLEKKIRQARYSITLKEGKKDYLNATDLANYTFCPASFSISNTFQIEYVTGEKEQKIGIDLHEKLRLVKRIKKFKETRRIEHALFHNKELLKIFESTIIYQGHGSESRKIFFNNDSFIASDPDYIFRDLNNKYFVVEEKYQYRKDPHKETYHEKWLQWNNLYDETDQNEYNERVKDWENLSPNFYKNHQIQVLTYLKNIQEYNLEYGYLIYWYYDFRSTREPYIHKVAIKKITINEHTLGLYNQIKTAINNLKTNQFEKFNILNMSPAKCINCSVNKYCGHKNRRYESLSFPYNLDYLRLYYE